MAKGRQPPKGRRKNNNGGVWKRRFYQALAVAAGFIPEEDTSLKKLMSIVSMERAGYGSEHSAPNQLSEIVDYVLRGQGADPQEILNAISETMPAEDVALVANTSVETVQENRQQARQARQQFGFFSQEAKAARKDLRQDRRANRRARRKGENGNSFNLFGNAVGFSLV